jgi:hypothetical protein
MITIVVPPAAHTQLLLSYLDPDSGELYCLRSLDLVRATKCSSVPQARHLSSAYFFCSFTASPR